MPPSRFILQSLLALALCATAGCGEPPPRVSAAKAFAPHAHDARHGGVTVELGDEEFHVEFAWAGTAGVIQAYILDGELENYVRVATESFSATVTLEGAERPLVFHAVGNSATGESAGDTALFEARADWLAARPALRVSVPSLSVKGRTYPNLFLELPAAKTQLP
jgi:hypothetical protein